jgi:hypothetical protein
MTPGFDPGQYTAAPLQTEGVIRFAGAVFAQIANHPAMTKRWPMRNYVGFMGMQATAGGGGVSLAPTANGREIEPEYSRHQASSDSAEHWLRRLGCMIAWYGRAAPGPGSARTATAWR